MLNRPYNDSQYQNTYNRSNYYGGSSNDIDPRLPFPPSIPPPPLPPPTASMGYAVGGWGANRGAVGGEGNSNINNNGVDYSRGGSNHFLPGGTWHTAALYTGAFPTAAQQYQQENSNTQPNETAPIGQQIPPYIANKETFPHQNNNNNNMDVSSIREGSQGRRPLANNHNQQHPITASGMEMQAMQRLISSARTRFVPTSNQQQQQPDGLMMMNSTSNTSGGVGDPFQNQYERQMAEQSHHYNVAVAESHARREQLLNSHRNSGGVALEQKLKQHRERNGPVSKPIIALDGTFRRTKTPQPSTQNPFHRDPASSGNLIRNFKNNNSSSSSSRVIPLSQAQTSLLSGGATTTRSHLPPGATTKTNLKGAAPNLKQSLAEGFAMRFQPEQIEQMRLPASVGEAALEISRYRTAAGGVDVSHQHNPIAPDSTYIHGVGDMFAKMKTQYLQMQKLGNSAYAPSPVPKNPNEPFKKYHPIDVTQNTSPLRVGIRGSSAIINTSRVMTTAGNNNNTNNISTSTTVAAATPLYSIAGTGTFRDQEQQVVSVSSPARGNNNNNNASSVLSPNYSRNIRFEAPKPSARALALRQELEALENQWKDLHQNTSSSSGVVADNRNTVSPEPQQPQQQQQNTTRTQVLGRINALLH